MKSPRATAIAMIALSLVTLALTPAPARADDPPTDEEKAKIAVDVPNAVVPSKRLVCGGQPTDAHLEEAAKKGFRLVINLRSKAEGPEGEKERVEAHGMIYVSIPMKGADGVTVENAKRLADALKKADDGPVLVHCRGGNRVGALFAMKAFHVDGESAEAAIALGKRHGLTHLEKVVRERLVPKKDD